MFKRILLDELDAKKRFYTDKVNSKLKYIREFYNEINLMKTFDSHAPFMNIQHALTSRSEIWKTWKITKKKRFNFFWTLESGYKTGIRKFDQLSTTV